MKWFQLAQMFGGMIASVIPGRAGEVARAITPLVLTGIAEAQQIHGDSSPAEKKQHVLNIVAAGAAAATETGKVTISQEEAANVTNAVFTAVDAINAVKKANEDPASADS